MLDIDKLLTRVFQSSVAELTTISTTFLLMDVQGMLNLSILSILSSCHRSHLKLVYALHVWGDDNFTLCSPCSFAIRILFKIKILLYIEAFSTFSARVGNK